VAKQRRPKKRPRVPQERRTLLEEAGKEQPREHSSGRCKNKRNKGSERAPEARGRSRERTFRKAGKPSRR
jgi:hypothetical protein